MRPPRRGRGPAPSRDRWVIPYADFVTLLFAFFTALYAVTSVDATKLPSVAEGLLGPSPATGGEGVLPDHSALVGDETRARADVRSRLERELHDDLAANRLELIEDRRGLVLAVPEAFSFDTGRADLSAAAEGLMMRVGRVLADVPNSVRIEGHTDNAPVRSGRFASNWDLSTARATRVVAYFIDQAGLPAGRLSAAGYSEFHPRAPNDSAAGRARNRRVDIVILNVATEAAEEPARTKPS